MHRQIFIFILQNWVSQRGTTMALMIVFSVGYSSLLIGPTLYSPSTVLFSPREKG
ncbi:hypothetical protein BGY98DRAFT_1010427 [Russula aff. rugulosa BPL654]|nr:hypothetical protein BGY98DRAFT_1010427 [Russula aff. rugulosa BPL654]